MIEAPQSVVDSLAPETAPVLDLGASPRPDPKKKPPWIAFGSIGILVALGLGYGVAGFLVANRSIDRASQAIGATLHHQKSVVATLDADPFKNIDLNGNPPDIAGARAALVAFEAHLSPSLAVDQADRAALQSARRDLAGSILTLPEQGSLAGARLRVDAALAGLAVADRQLGWQQQQTSFLHPFFDALDGWVAIEKAASADDAVGVAAQLQVVANAQQRLVPLAKSQAIPPQATSMVATLQQALADLHGLLSAAQADDQDGFTKYSAALTADGQTLAKFDSTVADNYEQTLFDPLTAQYNKEMTLAASGN